MMRRNMPIRCLLALLLSVSGRAQTLARRGWAGSGITVHAWYQDAFFFRFDPARVDDLPRRLDLLQGLSVDAVLLSPAPSDPGDERIDSLIREAGARHIRVLVDLSLAAPGTTQELSNLARFWLTRGVAGLHVTGTGSSVLTPLQVADRTHELVRLTGSFAGQRILLWDAPPDSGVTARSRRAATVPPVASAQLLLDPRLDGLTRANAADLRQALARLPQPGFTPVPFADLQRGGERARILATALLAGPGSPMVSSGPDSIDDASDAEDETAGPEALRDWMRRLGALRHANAALRGGSFEVIEQANPDIVAWVRRPADPASSPVVIVCNATERPIQVSLAAELRSLGLAAGSGTLHTLTATEDPSAPTVSAGAITLAPFAVYLGEAGHAPGLEAAPPSPGRARRSR